MGFEGLETNWKGMGVEDKGRVLAVLGTSEMAFQ